VLGWLIHWGVVLFGRAAFHLSEVKGPVMDQLKGSGFLQNLTGRVFLSQHQAQMAIGLVTA